MVERVNYDSQVNQIPVPYYYPPSSPAASKKKQIGTTVAGALIGMNAYYLPVKKDVFVQKGFDIKRNENFDQIRRLKKVAEEVEKGEISTQSKMILQDAGLSEDLTAITNKCSELEKEVTDPSSVKNIKDKFITAFDTYKKDTHLMDAQASDAFRAVRRNKFKWGAGIGAGVGLALGFMTSRN